MKYMGSKARLTKYILPIILKERKEHQCYVEPFGGGANSICQVENPRIYNDSNEYLSKFFHEAVYNNFTFPKDISRELYNWARDENKKVTTDQEALVGYIGINGSYGGRWFDGGYAGVTETKQGKVRNYPNEAYENVKKQIPSLYGCEFNYGDYKDIDIPPNSIVYCDVPYDNTKAYTAAKESEFDTHEFFEWCRYLVGLGHKVFISEYTAPDDFVCVWEKGVKSSLSANGIIGGNKNSTERLFVHESQI